MNVEELLSELESDQEWRVKEIRFLQNRMSGLGGEDERKQFRRVLVLMLYAHYEGFCKFAFNLYVNAINREGIACSSVNYAIAAASLSNLFKQLRNPNKKSDEFRNELPDDAQLHTFARDREFVQRTDELLGATVSIPETYVDMESNLWPVVLKKNLFKLGLPINAFDGIKGEISNLVNMRNDISHGNNREGLDEKKYLELKDRALTILNFVKREIMKALMNESYLKT